MDSRLILFPALTYFQSVFCTKPQFTCKVTPSGSILAQSGWAKCQSRLNGFVHWLLLENLIF